MKKILCLIGFALGICFYQYAKADNEFRFTSNNGGGYIFFTYSSCVYVNTQEKIPNKYYVYTTNSTGVRTSDGCYEYKHPFYVIDWNSGNRTAINVNTTEAINK